MILDLELNSATTEWAQLRDTAVAAEEAGVGAVWVFDHLSGTVLHGDRMLECFTLLGALAASTTTIELGSMVANVANRHPGVLATAAASVQAISNGRLLFGIGAGAAPGSRWSREHDSIGIPLRQSIADRHAAVEEALDLFDAALFDPDHPERRRMADLGVDRLVVDCLEPPPPDLFSRPGRSWRAT